MRERWTHPPVVAREAPPAWLSVWRFRAVALLVLAAAVVAAVLVFRWATGATDQDPDVNAVGTPAVLQHAA